MNFSLWPFLWFRLPWRLLKEQSRRKQNLTRERSHDDNPENLSKLFKPFTLQGKHFTLPKDKLT